MQLKSKRLILRPIQLSDAGAFFAYRSDAETNKFQGWIPKTLDEAEAFIAKSATTINEPGTWFQLVLIEHTSGEVIGDVGIHFIDTDGHQVELGCTLGKAHHGNGYATEALQAVIDYLFKKLNKHRIIASIDPGNTASIKMVERMGFRKEAHFKESLLINGNWVDDVVYALLQKEWK